MPSSFPPRFLCCHTLCALLCWMVLSLFLGTAHAQLNLSFSSPASAAPTDIVTTPRVQAHLVVHAPHGIQPGQPLTLGLRIVHQPAWHTYWKNAGDSGLPTQLQWQLPPGITTSDIAWPSPQAIRVGDLLNYGYENTVLLPVPAQVAAGFQPDTQGMLDVRVHASWLVCRVECIPEEGQFHLRLPAEVPHTMWEQEFKAAAAQTPQALPGAVAQATANSNSDRVQLHVQGLPAAVHGQTLGFFPEDSDTFVHAAVLGQDWSQSWDGETWTADLPLSSMRGPTPEQLAVVLAPLVTQDSDTAAHPGWRLTIPVQGRWKDAALAQVSPALAAALAANAQAAAAPVDASNRRSTLGLVSALLGGLLGGMLLNLMPCVFPVLAIKLLGFARHGADARAQRANGLAYSAGVVLSFAALGMALLALRTAGEQLGWGFQLQSPAFVATLAALFTLIGLNLAGLFELGHVVPDRLANLHARHPLGDAFVSGVVAVAIASPCTAPFMGASLGFALGMHPIEAIAVFVSLGVGMALPYILVSWVPGLIRWLPRPGAWMDTFRKAMAFPMFATVVWLVWVLGQQSGIDGAAALLTLLLCLTALVWALTLRGKTRIAMGVLALCVSAWMLSWMGRSLLQAVPATGVTARTAGWQTWSTDRQAELLAQGQAVFVDYTAAWCVTCQYNKRTTLANPSVLANFEKRHVALLRADWTRRDPAITESLAALGRSGVPVYVLLAPGAAPVVLSELLSTEEVHAALAQLPPLKNESNKP